MASLILAILDLGFCYHCQFPDKPQFISPKHNVNQMSLHNWRTWNTIFKQAWLALRFTLKFSLRNEKLKPHVSCSDNAIDILNWRCIKLFIIYSRFCLHVFWPEKWLLVKQTWLPSRKQLCLLSVTYATSIGPRHNFLVWGYPELRRTSYSALESCEICAACEEGTTTKSFDKSTRR